MKLLFILPEYLRESVGGIRTFYVNLLPELVRFGCHVKVLLARREFADGVAFVDESGVEVEYIRGDLLEKHDRVCRESQFAGNWLVCEFLPVANAVFEQARAGEGYDLVEVTDWPLIFVPWCAQKSANTPFTVSLHSSMGQMFKYEKQSFNPLDKALIRMVEALCFASSASIHANSNLNARYWEKITNRKVDVLLPLMGNFNLTTKNTNAHENLTTDNTDEHGWEKRRAAPGDPGLALSPQNSVTSKLARDSEDTSLTRSASSPACAQIVPEDRSSEIVERELGSAWGSQLADSAGFLEGQSQAGLQMENQKSCNIRFANDPGASGENCSSVIMPDILGQKTSEVPEALAIDSRPRLRGAVFARLQNLKGCEILAEALAEFVGIEIHWFGSDVVNAMQGCIWSESLARKFPEVFGRSFIYHPSVTADEVPCLMLDYDFVCVPSLWDVFNLTVIEAMSLGRVVLCSRQAGAEMLIEDGVNGFLFEPNHHGELVKKLKQIACLSPDERERIGRVARESVRDKLQPERLIQHRIAYYQSVAAQMPEENRNCFLPDILEPKPVAVKTWGRRIYELRRKIGI